VFVSRPISGTLMTLIAGFVTWQVVAFFLQSRKMAALRLQPE
jgi:hypothetical protein